MQSSVHFSPFCALKGLITEKNITIFTSGSGTDAENIVRYFEENGPIKVELVLPSRKDAHVLECAHRLGMSCRAFPKSDWRIAESILDLLRGHQIDLIVLTGFLLRIPSALLHVCPNRAINIRPALLSKFGGRRMYGDRVHETVVMAEESEGGIIIHYIDEHYNEGSIIFQAKCSVLPGSALAEVAKKARALECKWFPKIIGRTVNTFLQSWFSEEVFYSIV